MTKRPKTAIVQTGLRLPEALRARIEKRAKDRGVSLNSEIVDRLENSELRSGLLYEVLQLAYGPVVAPIFAEANRADLLRLKPGEKDKLKQLLNKVVDHHFKEKGPKS